MPVEITSCFQTLLYLIKDNLLLPILLYKKGKKRKISPIITLVCMRDFGIKLLCIFVHKLSMLLYLLIKKMHKM